MNGQGDRTAEFGRWLTERIKCPPYEAFYDHGDSKQPNVVAIKGFVGQGEVSNLNRLADVDLMIVEDDVVRLLIEIEERPSSPKKILGAIMGSLVCDRFAIRSKDKRPKQRYFRPDEETLLIVAGIASDAGHRLDRLGTVVPARVQLMGGILGCILPKNVRVITEATIDATIRELEIAVKRWLR